MVKVVKFGGSSLASADQFKKVGNIIRAEESRRYVVRRVLRQLRKDTMKLSRDLDLSFH